MPGLFDLKLLETYRSEYQTSRGDSDNERSGATAICSNIYLRSHKTLSQFSTAVGQSISRIISENPAMIFSIRVFYKIPCRYCLQRQISKNKFLLYTVFTYHLKHNLPQTCQIYQYSNLKFHKMCHYQNTFYSCGHFYDKFMDKPCRRVKPGRRCQGFEEHEEFLAALCQGCKNIIREAGERVRRRLA
jgi:hypothetical protein